MQDQPEYLTENHIRIFDAAHRELQPSQIDWYSDDAVHYTFREDPGDFNSLGAIRINFPSAIRRLHARHAAEEFVRRRFSFPFVRLRAGPERAGPGRVAAHRDQGVVARAHRPGASSPATKDAKLTKPVPLHWVYVTAWSASDGVVQFREDIYGRDGLGAPAIPATTKL